MSDRNWNLLLVDIQQAINHIFTFTAQHSFEQFCSSIQVKHAVLHNFAIIGEAASKLPDTFKHKYSEVQWREIKGFRNYVIHEYFGLDDAIVWEIIQNDLPLLKRSIETILFED